MELERQMAWPCHGCAVRATNFCNALVGRASASPPTEKDLFSQIFFTAEKNEVIRHAADGKSFGPYVLCQGWAFRFHSFPDGRRQILSVLVPGDLFFTSTLGEALPEFSIQSATGIQFCELSRDGTKSGIAGTPTIFDAFKNFCVQDSRDSIATLNNFNEPNLTKRVTNFARGIVKRLAARNIEIATDVYPFPLTHADIADATGIGVADVNRAIQFLRADRIIDLSDGQLTILSADKFEDRTPTPIHYDIANAISHSEIRLL